MEKNNLKICLLGASFGTNNMGVNALTMGTIKSLFYRFPYAELFLLDYGEEKKSYMFESDGRKIPVQIENMRFSKKFYLRNNIALLLVISLVARLVPSKKIKKRLLYGNPCLKRLSEASIVASIAGGDSFSDIYGIGRFFYVALPQLLALFMGKKLVLLPQTIGPYKGIVATMVAKYILKEADIVYSRDYEGVEEVRTLLGYRGDSNVKVRFCYDVGFVLDPVRPVNMNLHLGDKKNGRGGSLVGFNISGLLHMGGYSRNNMFGLKIDYKGFITDLIDFMIRKKNAIVIIVPHVFGTHGESDSIVCKDVYASMKERYQERILLADGEYDQSEIKHIIGLCDFFIGARMHACIAALSQNVPTVSIAYSKKFKGVMRSIGVEYLVADPRKLGQEEIMGLIDEAFDRRTELREHLEKTMPHVREMVLNLFCEINPLEVAG